MSREMSEFKIGDRVELVGENWNMNINVGDVGTVVANSGLFIGVDFDRDTGGHSCDGRGRLGHCWNIPCEDLEKLEEAEEEAKEEETKEEIKTETMEQKILEVLREEIGVEIGEEFDVYGKGEKQWTCKFEKNEFTHKMNDKFLKSGLWKSIVGDFHGYQFKRKSFMPEYGEDYFSLAIDYDENKNVFFGVLQSTWVDNSIDYGMLALGNVFRNEEEALKSRNEMLERLEELRNGE